MAGSKSFVITALLCTLLLLLMISSEVAAARDLAQTSTRQQNTETTTTTKTKGKDNVKYPGGYRGQGSAYEQPPSYGSDPGSGPGGYPRGSYGGNPGGSGGGGYCQYGCCSSGYNYYGRGCGRCCSYAGEAVEATTKAKLHN